MTITDIVDSALSRGSLTAAEEKQIERLLGRPYSEADIQALDRLMAAMIHEMVERESA